MTIARQIALLGMFAALALASQGAAAQGDKKAENPESAQGSSANKHLNVYRLDFALSEFVDGKKVNTRNYTVTAREDETNKLRSGSRYPVATGTAEKTVQYQYLDVGVSIDCRVVERGGYLELNAVIDSSDIETPDARRVPNLMTQDPIIGQMKSDIRTLIRPGTATMVSSMEDPASKRRFQVDVTATKAD